MKGSVEIDGRTVEWDVSAGLVMFYGIYAINLPGPLTVEAIEAALRGWHQGYTQGKHDGRSILQNAFRNLMDCQK